ncbi:hypothetical protein JXB41_03750 [Candidatus Woesearchaeota archaeon]|nr:hypothetical protein [Candidatus Woesearchaeota archaeon]
MLKANLLKKSGFIIGLFIVFVIVLNLPVVYAPAGNVCNWTSPCQCGSNCYFGNTYLNEYNTINDCQDGYNDNYEWVHDITVTNLNDSVFNGGDVIEIDAYFRFDLDTEEISFVYHNGSAWKHLADMTDSGYEGYKHKYLNLTLDNVKAYHTVRAIVCWSGAAGMTCGYDYDIKYSDTDDLSFYVLEEGATPDTTNPAVKDLSPDGTTYTYSSDLVVNISANVTDDVNVSSVRANITWTGNSQTVELTELSGNIYQGNISGFINLGRYDFTIIANDTLNNINNTETGYFYVNMTGNITVSSPEEDGLYKYGDAYLFYELPENYTLAQTWYSLNGDSPVYVNSNFKISEENTDQQLAQYELDYAYGNLSQSFYTIAEMDIEKISVKLKKNSSGTSNSMVEIRSDNNGLPSDSILAYGNISDADVSGSDFSWVNITLNQTLNLNADMGYWLFLTPNGSSADFFMWESNDDNSYTLGNYSNNASKDLLFIVYDRYKYNISLSSIDKNDHTIQVFANSTTLLDIESPLISFAVDHEEPEIVSVDYSPDDSESLDPEVLINVSAEIIEDLETEIVSLYYKLSSQSIWENTTMINFSDMYYGNFTPDSEGTWEFYVFAIDTSENKFEGELFEPEIYYEKSWNITPEQFNSTGSLINSNVSIGNLTINNSADFAYEFNISTIQSSPVIYYNDSVSKQIILQPHSTAVIEVRGSTKSIPSEDEINIVVDALNSSASPSLLYNNFTFISALSGSYLHVDIVSYDPSVTQGDNIFSLKARITNIGNETAYNVTALWTLPSGWSSRDELNNTYDNLTSGGYEAIEFEISADVNESAPTGEKTLLIEVNCSAGRYDSDSRTVTVNSASQEQQQQQDDSSGGTSTTTLRSGGGTFIIKDQEIYFNITDIEIGRGRTKNISFFILNNASGTIINNILIKLEGLYQNYYRIIPDYIEKLNYSSEQIIDLRIEVPTYMQIGKHKLKLIASTAEKEFSKEFNLIVIDSKLIIERCLNDSFKMIEEFRSRGFNIHVLENSYNNAIREFEQKNYDLAEQGCEYISEQYNNALTVDKELAALEEQVNYFIKQGYDVSDLKASLDLVRNAFDEGDFEKASDNLEQAKIIFSLVPKIQKSFLQRLSDFIRFNYKKILFSIPFIIIITYLLKQYVYVNYRKTRLQNLKQEEKQILELIKQTQIEHFEEKIMGKRLYRTYMNEYGKRMARIKKSIIKLEIMKTKHTKGVKDLNMEKEKLILVIKELQKSFYEDKVLDRESYQKLIAEYQTELSEVEEQISLKDPYGKVHEDRKQENKEQQNKNQEKKDEKKEKQLKENQTKDNQSTSNQENKEQEKNKQEDIVTQQKKPAEFISEKPSEKPLTKQITVNEKNQDETLHRTKNRNKRPKINPKTRKKPTEKIPEEKYFVLKNSKMLGSIHDLFDELDTMPGDVFEHHVTTDRNDFATWINDVFRETELSSAIRKIKTKNELKIEIKKFIENEI